MSHSRFPFSRVKEDLTLCREYSQHILSPANRAYIFILIICFISFNAQSVGAVEYECPGYDARQSDGEVPVMLELWGMLSTPLLP